LRISANQLNFGNFFWEFFFGKSGEPSVTGLTSQSLTMESAYELSRQFELDVSWVAPLVYLTLEILNLFG
jgi:hypothetical protein